MTKKILYIDHVAHIGGAEISLLHMVKGVKANKQVAVKVVLPEDGPLVDELKKLNIDVDIIPMVQLNITKNPLALASYPLFLVKYIFQLLHFVNRYDIDLVHANSIKSGLLVGVVTKLARVPLIWHIRDYYEPGWIRTLVRVWGKLFADCIVAISQKVNNMFHHMDSLVIYNGVDLTLFSQAKINKSSLTLREEIGIESTKKIICIVGQLAPWKGHKTFIEVAAQIQGKFPQLHFVIVGDVYHQEQKSYRHQLETLAKDLLPTGTITFLGWRSDIDLIMNSIDILLHPAYEEPFGRVVIEAMAARKPVIGFSSGGLPEIIKNEETGFLVPTGNTKLMVQKLAQLLEDDRLCKIMGEQSYQRVVEHFSIQSNVKQVSHIYEQFIP